LIGAGASPVVATLPPGSLDPGIDGLAVVVLPEAGLDMFGSLRIGLGRFPEVSGWRKVAILPVDHPLVRPEAVKILAGTDGRGVIPSFKGKHGHPICLDRDVVSAISRGELTGPTLREILRTIGAVDVEVDDPGVVANCNTPAALSAALRAASSGL
jgi:CTP:molybdopterin cytidylyltransferase MocA